MLIDAWFPFIGGGQIHVANLIKHLESRHPVKVTLFHAPHHNIIIRILWCFWVIPHVLLAASHQRFDLIHAHAFAPGIPAKILSWLLNIPVAYTVHGSHLMDLGASGPKAWLEKLILTRIRYTHQISVTQAFLKYSNVNRHRSYIPNGVDLSLFNQIKILKHKQFTFLFVGRDHPSKGLHILRQAWSKFWSQYPDTKLDLVTSGAITGIQLIHHYSQAHVFVLPSLAEGQPLVLLEAWAAKLPVIVTGIPGILDTVTPGKDAIIVPPGDVTSLHQALVKLFKMPQRRRDNLGENGYTKVKKDYTWAKVAASTFSVYQQLCASA